MAEVKWVKITTSMFDNRKIKHLRRLPDGNNIVLIWVMLLTMAGRCNAGGMVFLTENIPYTPKMLADELDFEENTVALALRALEQFGMICTDENCFRIANWDKYQNIEGLDLIREQNRKRVAKLRNKRKQASLPEGGTETEKPADEPCNVTCNVTVTDGNAIERELELERDLERDIRKKKKKPPKALFDRLSPAYHLSPELQAKMAEWIAYKVERKEAYKETGLKALLRRVENNAAAYGDAAMCELIDDCMGNNWAGIIFDRLDNKTRKAGNGNAVHRTSIEEKPDDGRYGITL